MEAKIVKGYHPRFKTGGKMKEEGDYLCRLFHKSWNALSATLKMNIYYSRQTFGIVHSCVSASNYTFHPPKMVHS